MISLNFETLDKIARNQITHTVPMIKSQLDDHPLCYTNSVLPSVTLVDCGHTAKPIETILFPLESPNIRVSEKVRLIDIGHL